METVIETEKPVDNSQQETVVSTPTEKPVAESKGEKPKLRETIKAAIEEVNEKNAPQKDDKATKEAPKTGRERDENGKFAIKESSKIAHEKTPDSGIKAPEGWKTELKAEWPKLPASVQAEISRREQDMHKNITTMDNERAFAREMQNAILPYMPLINQVQSTPAKAVTEMLNYAHILQTGNPQAKGHLLWQLAQRHGADMRANPQSQGQPQNQIQNIMQELAETKKQLARLPQDIKQQQETAQLKSIIDAFASDPNNVHYERVKGSMAALLSSGVAKDMKDAYDRACYADPEIRSTLQAEDEKAKEAKRIADTKAKAGAARNAAVSVKGSAGMNGSTPPAPKRSLREELRAQLRAAQV